MQKERPCGVAAFPSEDFRVELGPLTPTDPIAVSTHGQPVATFYPVPGIDHRFWAIWFTGELLERHRAVVSVPFWERVIRRVTAILKRRA